MPESYSMAVPVIATADVVATCRYFEAVLGFRQMWAWGEPPVYAGVKGGDALVYISYDPGTAEAIRDLKLTPDVFLWVRDIERVYAQHRNNGAEIVEELAARPWG